MDIMEEIKKQYPDADIKKVERHGYSTVVLTASEEKDFEQFWLETNSFYGMVHERNIFVLKKVHPYFTSYAEAKKKILGPGEFEAFAEFGIGDEYNGMLLADWLKEKNMLHFFN